MAGLSVNAMQSKTLSLLPVIVALAAGALVTSPDALAAKPRAAAAGPTAARSIPAR